jgi:hypothetical protein
VIDKPEWVQWLKWIKDKGNKKHTKRTAGTGAREIDVLNQASPLALCCDPITAEQALLVENSGFPELTRDVEILYPSATDSCVPLSLCNMLGSGKKKKMRLMEAFAAGTKFGGFNDLAGVSQVTLKKKLLKVHGMTLKSLVALGYGQYLIMDGTHCVGVDCKRGLVFDCAEKWALPLTEEALTRCQIKKFDEIRRVI